ncbi:MAG: DNA primase [Tissierellia bacterium]|nr:DNA primase [Tissierellia bacterium]
MAKKYVDDIARILCEHVDIIDVVGQRVALKKTGKNHKGLCPFHAEKTPSFIVSEERQSYRCFGCGAGGNSLNFVMESENLDFLTAIETLAERYHFDLNPYKNKQSGPVRRDLKTFYELNRKAALRYYANLKENNDAREYLLGRGLSEKTLVHYGLGYAKDGWHHLYDEIGKELPEDIRKESGLFGEGARGPYDRFRDRIIFPIIDLRRRVIGFGARTMDPEGIPKYLNSSDTPVFNKSFHLYGLNQAKDFRGTDKIILLVEGYMDVISLYDKGIGNAVASLGTAFTQEQAKLLERYCSELIILYDGDTAGIDATKRALEILDGFAMLVRVVTLPQSMDPDDYIKAHGKEGFLQFIEENALESIEYRLREREAHHDLKTIHGKKAYLEDIGVILGKIDKYSQQDLYLRYVSNRLNIDPEELRKDLEVVKKEPLRQSARNTFDEAPGILMALLVQKPSLAQKINSHRWYSLLEESWKEVVEFLLKEEQFVLEKAADCFSLDQLTYMEKCKNMELSDTDSKHWEDFFRYLLAKQLDSRVRNLQNDPEGSALEEIMLLQKMRIEIMAKERGGR